MKVVAIIIIVLGIYIIYVYNKALKWDQKVDNSWNQISIQLKAKINIIPNLVDITEKYAQYENDLFNSLTKNRQNLINSETVNENIKNSDILNTDIEKLYAIAEGYPELMSSKLFIDLQRQFIEIENEIATYRQFYNDTVMLYNRFIKTFPHNIFVNLFGYKEIEYLNFYNKE